MSIIDAARNIARRLMPKASGQDYIIDPRSADLHDKRTLADVLEAAFSKVPETVRRLGHGANGCWSYKVKAEGRWLKCFECASAERASLVERAAGLLGAAGVRIPEVVSIDGHVVIAEWIDGRPLHGHCDAEIIGRMAAYQSGIHGACGEAGPGDGRFIHMEWLLERLLSCGGRHAGREGLRELCGRVASLVPAGLKPGVVHPDFIMSNIVEDSAGALVVVDNEFLGVGTGFEFDVLNTAYIMFPKDGPARERYIGAYRAGGETGTLDTHREFWEICRLVKLAGKRLRDGRTDEAQAHLVRLQEMVSLYDDKKGN